jgi:hypothetical protein
MLSSAESDKYFYLAEKYEIIIIIAKVSHHFSIA